MMTRFQSGHSGRRFPAPWLCLLAALLAGPVTVQAQAVAVTLTLDTNLVTVGSTTVLHVGAQILPGLRADSDRIFSWYVDVVNTNGAAAAAQYQFLTRPASDNDPLVSSAGFDDPPNRRGIYDTFLNLPGAGRDGLVELVRVPVTGLTEGSTRLLVRAGTGVPALTADFIVAPLTGGDPLLGGDYSAAFVDLLVVPRCDVRLSITPEPNPPRRVRLSFTPCSGYDHVIEFKPDLNAATAWQPLPGGPHNSGSVVVPADQQQRFFRVRTTWRMGGTGET